MTEEKDPEVGADKRVADRPVEGERVGSASEARRDGDAPEGGGSAPEGEHGDGDADPYRLERLSRLSCKVGIVAMGMGMVAPCFCSVPWLFALPLSAFGATMARWAYDHAEPKTADRAYAKVGLVTNVTALVLSLMFNLTIAAYVAFFGLLVVLD